MTPVDHANTEAGDVARIKTVARDCERRGITRSTDYRTEDVLALIAQAESKGAAGWARAMARSAELEKRAEAAEADRDEATRVANEMELLAQGAMKLKYEAEDERDRLADVIRTASGLIWAKQEGNAQVVLDAALAETEHTP